MGNISAKFAPVPKTFTPDGQKSAGEAGYLPPDGQKSAGEAGYLPSGGQKSAGEANRLLPDVAPLPVGAALARREYPWRVYFDLQYTPRGYIMSETEEEKQKI